MYEFSACPALWSACLTLLIGHTKTLCSLTFLDAAMIRFASNAGGGFSAGSRSSNLGDLYAESRQISQGSFSAVSKPKFARKYALKSSRRDLHNALPVLESNPQNQENHGAPFSWNPSVLVESVWVKKYTKINMESKLNFFVLKSLNNLQFLQTLKFCYRIN